MPLGSLLGKAWNSSSLRYIPVLSRKGLLPLSSVLGGLLCPEPPTADGFDDANSSTEAPLNVNHQSLLVFDCWAVLCPTLTVAGWLGTRCLLAQHHPPTNVCMFVCSLLRHCAVRAATPAPCHLHTSSWRADSSRASLTRLRRQAYARLYPVLLVKQDGSTIHIRYREPRRMLVVSVLQ